jgi:hypothetical protein
LPESLSINAWNGEEVGTSASLAPEASDWALGKRGEQLHHLAAEGDPEFRKWSDPRVGWGLLLPENEEISPAERATAADTPAPIQKLLESRPGSPVLRYVKSIAPEQLRRYFPSGSHADLAITGTKRGLGDEKLPLYLLICASPTAVPWRVHYVLNQPFHVGRLRPDMPGLGHYVGALIDGWSGAGSRSKHPLVWATDHDPEDISHLMRESIAEPVASQLAGDGDVAQTTQLYDTDATGAKLIQSLAAEKPGLVVTSSHGMTGPVGHPDKMRRQLGVPVDDGHHVLDVDALLGAWEPDGAIWYAHACCSAGGDTGTIYEGLLHPGSSAGQIVHAVAELGAQVAPLPERLLGAPKPLRAFVGHVEPTFDWTLRHPQSQQQLTDSIVRGLYKGFYQPEPETVGMAFAACHKAAGDLFGQWVQLLEQSPLSSPETRPKALRLQLTALDRQSLVILGDPTVAPPSVVG